MAIQRLYAARNARVLQRSLALMVCMPLFTTTIALVAGLYAAGQLADVVKPDSVLPLLCATLVEQSLLGKVLVLVIFAAVLAALMSTADSALLSIASLATRDVYARHIAPASDEARLSAISKRLSWLVMAVLVFIALFELADLKGLLDIKLEMLAQVSPAFFLGLHTRVRRGPILAGLCTGVVVALGLKFGGYASVSGLHAGTVGLAFNFAAVAACELVGRFLMPDLRKPDDTSIR
jgi:SSS family solute:Na+ symporter/sodium/pantothenate symporter